MGHCDKRNTGHINMKLIILAITVAVAYAQNDCDYNGMTYHTGDRFMDSEGCNNCFCSNGAVACTMKFCLPKTTTCLYNGTTFATGASFKSLDGCNTCGCHNGMIMCTEMACFRMNENVLCPVTTYVQCHIAF